MALHKIYPNQQISLNKKKNQQNLRLDKIFSPINNIRVHLANIFKFTDILLIAAEHFDPAAIALVSQPAPAFLQAMNFRAQQRQLRHQATQERRKQREEEIRLAKEREEQIKVIHS